ncbi:MAG TPA: hypothetical protein VKT99_16345 [Xanthobacteraceae bacterium]|jgi:hypothetical protein|nr:hypothetical protein [Xanthobacteraceae bacterium]
MGVKLFAALFGLTLASAAPMSSGAAAFEEGVQAAAYKRHAVRLFGPRSYYAPVVVRALFDSCWRYRINRAPARFWTCGNYIKPNAEFDWGYGSSIADQAARYGYLLQPYR